MKPRPATTAARHDFSRSMPSRLAEVDAACLALRSFLESHHHTADAFVIELSTRECLNNAILHGNRRHPRKLVHLGVRLGPRWLRLQFSDEGPGFPWRRHSPLPNPEATGGRGLAIIDRNADRVVFNRSGNQVTLWFARHGNPRRQLT